MGLTEDVDSFLKVILALAVENYYRGPTKDTYPD